MSYLYAVQMIIYGYPFAPVKIGISEKPDVRARAYTSGPFPNVWLGSWSVVDGRESEKRLHKRFASYRLVGEWFYAAMPLVAYIEKKLGGSIQSKLASKPGRLKSGFQHRFVALFPNGVTDLEREWTNPGEASPCSGLLFMSAQAELDALDAVIH